MGFTEDGPAILRALGVQGASAAFLLGQGGTPGSICARWALVYAYWYAMLHVNYYTWGVLLTLGGWLGLQRRPRQPWREAMRHILGAERAFPLLTSIGFMSEQLRVSGVSRACAGVRECGGWPATVALSAVWFLFAELLAYLNHRYLLHGVERLKPFIAHGVHHAPVRACEMSAWSGYTFSGVDGVVQSLPMVVAQVLLPAPAPFVKAYAVAVAVWTMYIHGESGIGWPFLGPDYHLIHHQHNWYNFGFLTCFWDTALGTIKHPYAKVSGTRDSRDVGTWSRSQVVRGEGSAARQLHGKEKRA